MENVAEKNQVCKEKNEIQENEWWEKIPGAIDFFELLELKVKEMVHFVMSKAINEEFRQYIGADVYERNKERKDHRNGFRYRNFESRFGVIEDIPIPRAKKIIADIFLRGVSTRKIKSITKALWGREYSPTTISEFNKTLKEDLLKWLNRRIEISFWIL
jgi:putative transposase